MTGVDPFTAILNFEHQITHLNPAGTVWRAFDVELETGYLQPLTLAGYSSEEKSSWFDEVAHLRLSDYLSPDTVARLLKGEVVLNHPSKQTVLDTGAEENRSLLIAPLCIDSHLLGLLLLDWDSTRHIHTPKEGVICAKLT